MAGQSRTLKLSILADVDQLKKSLNAANNDVENSSSRIGDFGKKAGLAFAVAGAAAAAYAGKLLIDGVKSAIEDEAAQAKLALTLQNVAGATNATVAATEAFILRTSLATGIADNQLRPSLERLVRATGDVTAAQNLQTLAIDVAAGSGKSLEAVSNAIGKAFEGNSLALGKLGIGLSAAELKSMSFNEVTLALSETFAGQATEQAETFAGKMDRLKVAFDEGKETVGSFVLDGITPLLTLFTEKVVPIIAEFAQKIGPELKPILADIAEFVTGTFIPAFLAYYNFIFEKVVPILVTALKPALSGIKTVFDAVGEAIEKNQAAIGLLKDGLSGLLAIARIVLPLIGGAFKLAFSGVAVIIDGVSMAARGIVSAINAVISAVNALIRAFNIVNNIIPGSKDIASIPKRAMGGPVSSNSPFIVGERGPELFVPSMNGRIVPNNKLSTGGATFNIVVNGAIDAEGTARTIIDTLNNSFFRGTGGSNNLVTA